MRPPFRLWYSSGVRRAGHACLRPAARQEKSPTRRRPARGVTIAGSEAGFGGQNMPSPRTGAARLREHVVLLAEPQRTDAELLDQFVATGDEAAFSALV